MNLSRAVSSIFTVAEMEARKIRHDSTELWMRSIQPALWLLIFGSVLSAVRGLVPSGYTYIQYIAPGILAQSVLFVAIFYGITIVWERDVGLLTKLLSTPSPRSAIIIGKALAAGVRGIFQGIVIFALALIIGVNLKVELLNVLGIFVIVIFLAMSFSSLSMILASFFRTRDKMMGIGQAITMPLFFASSAIYPVSLMPGWLKVVSYVNPLSYVVDAMRALLLPGYQADMPVDVLAMLISTVVLVSLASAVIKRLVQ